MTGPSWALVSVTAVMVPAFLLVLWLTRPTRPRGDDDTTTPSS